MSETSSSSNITKKKILVKKKKKKIVEDKLNEKYSSTNLNDLYLDYDFDIDSRFKANLKKETNKFNSDIINNLPKMNLEIKQSTNKKRTVEKKQTKKSLKEQLNTQKLTDIEEIDIEDLEEQIIGNKKYYIDENKGNIYDMNINLIGQIDEYGEINI